MISNKMKIKASLKNLERKGVISRKPNPIIPFILALIILILYRNALAINQTLAKFALFLFALAIIFAIIHLLVYKILTSK